MFTDCSIGLPKLLLKGNSFDTKFPVAILEADRFIDGVTERQIVDYLTWCQTVLQNGVWPANGYRGEAFTDSYRWHHRGETLAGPWIGAFCLWKGDLKAKVFEEAWGSSPYAATLCLPQEHFATPPFLWF
jgi:hypothetical protein